MNRWKERYEEHAFHVKWKKLKDHVNDIGFSVEELTRLKKVINHISKLLESADKELFPLLVLTNCESYVESCFQQLYKNEVKNVEPVHTTEIKNMESVHTTEIKNIQLANEQIDRIFHEVCPYTVLGKSAAQAAVRSFTEYVSKVDAKTEQLTKKEAELNELVKNIAELEKYLFSVDDSKKTLKDRVDEVFDDIGGSKKKIAEFVERLFKGNGVEKAITNQIEEAQVKVQNNCEAIEETKKTVSSEVEGLKTFYTEAFGAAEEDGKGGYKKELKNLMDELKKHKTETEKIYNDQKKQIESLLPGATSAGLAAAYNEQKSSSKALARRYTWLFYGAVFFFFVTAGLLTSNLLDKWLSIGHENSASFIAWLELLIYRLPLFGPFLWLAIFATKRRSELQRLEQEYAHKEALAKSYMSFKKEIEKLGEEGKDLTQRLLKSTINAISFNPSTTLDKKHGDKMPLQEAIEKFLKEIGKSKGKKNEDGK